MDLKFGAPELQKFVTNVGLITSKGTHGDNIMACEWTHMISYAPALVALGIRKNKATVENILETKFFGVNICSEDQNVVSSVAGGHTGKEVDKIALLKELGVTFSQGEKVDVLMVEGACMQAECKLVEYVEMGDHPLIIGEMETVKVNKKEPLSYYQGRYHQVGAEIEKPTAEFREKVKKLAEKYKK